MWDSMYKRRVHIHPQALLTLLLPLPSPPRLTGSTERSTSYATSHTPMSSAS